MTESQLIEALAVKMAVRKSVAKDGLDEMLAIVSRELRDEGTSRIPRLGILRKKQSAGRNGRNPKSGEQIEIPARTRLRFTPFKALKESVLG